MAVKPTNLTYELGHGGCVGSATDVMEGDEAVLIGTQGSESIWADELAVLCGTIPYEILTDIKERLERSYVNKYCVSVYPHEPAPKGRALR